MTTWTNPCTSDPISVTVATGRVLKHPAPIAREDGSHAVLEEEERVAVVWQPGETKAVPTRFARAIHIVLGCSHHDCRNAICKDPESAGPKATVIGGGAPLLQRSGQTYGIPGSLIPRAAPPPQSVSPADVGNMLARREADQTDPAMARARRAGT